MIDHQITSALPFDIVPAFFCFDTGTCHYFNLIEKKWFDLLSPSGQTENSYPLTKELS